jgi:hypothetical protein
MQVRLCGLASVVVTNCKLRTCSQFQIVRLSYSDTEIGIKTAATEAKLFNNYYLLILPLCS